MLFVREKGGGLGAGEAEKLYLLTAFQSIVEDILYERGEEALGVCQRQDGTVPVVSDAVSSPSPVCSFSTCLCVCVCVGGDMCGDVYMCLHLRVCA